MLKVGLERMKRIFLNPIFGVVFFSLLLHYPRFFFIFDQSQNLLHTQPWANNMQLLCNWDCLHYVEQGVGFPFKFSAFFPLFPFLLRIIFPFFHFLTPEQTTVLVSNILSWVVVGGAVVLGARLWPSENRLDTFYGKPKAGWLLALAISIFPFSQFQSYGYSEPLFLIVFGVLVAFAQREKWLESAICAGLIAVCRPQGIWVLACFLALYTCRAIRKKERLSTYLQVGLISVIPLVIYMFWNQMNQGDFLYFVKVQSKWNRKFNFWGGLQGNLPRYEMNHIFLYLSLFAGFRFMRRNELHWKLLGLTSIVCAEIPLFIGGYMLSYSRFTSSNLGFFVLIAELLFSYPVITIAYIFWAIPRLSVEVYKWLTAIGYNGIGP